MEDMLKQILGEVKEMRSEMKSDIEELKAGQSRIEEKLDNLTTETRSNHKQLTERMDDHQRAIEAVGEELSGTNFKIKTLSGKYGEHTIEIESLIRQIKS
ncbi:hypothetical protein bcgnr5369_23960 [Bacillus cereus]|uniref:Uncharacterized protein n=1 Tax=Bacillus thuringiensis TaxID=1428 RepID=A0A9X6WHG2_BACTU|nr:hypothetical protein [Bacillus thuringiensis]PFJ27142.1 hypothetical protein COJ15_34495 [Bacillus thuringiensis]